MKCYFLISAKKPTKNKVEAYLRLEDVHPAADINQLKEIAELLKEKKDALHDYCYSGI